MNSIGKFQQNEMLTHVLYINLASLAFLNNGKKLGFLEKTCNHSQVLSDFFGPSCIPGATDSAHDIDDLRDNLCSMCPQTNSGGISAVPSVPLATNEQLPDYKPLGELCD